MNGNDIESGARRKSPQNKKPDDGKHAFTYVPKYVEEFHNRHQVGINNEIPETKQIIAKELAQNLAEHIGDLPEEELSIIAYQLATRVIEIWSREITGTFAGWKRKNPDKAILADVIVRAVLDLEDKVAVPRSIDPRDLIEQIKTEGNLAKLPENGQAQTKLEQKLYAMVVGAIGKMEALKIEQGKITRAAEERVSKAKAEEEEIRKRIDVLQSTMAALRQEALSDSNSNITEALARMDSSTFENKSLALERKALNCVDTIEAIIKTSENTEEDLNKRTERAREFLNMLQIFDSEIVATLQTIETEFGVGKRIQVANKLIKKMQSKQFERFSSNVSTGDNFERTLYDFYNHKLIRGLFSKKGTYDGHITKEKFYKFGYNIRLDGRLFKAYIMTLIGKEEKVEEIRERLNSAFSKFYSQETPDLYDINATINSLTTYR